MNLSKMVNCVLNNKKIIMLAVSFALLAVLRIPMALGDPPPMNPQTPFPVMPYDNYTSAKD
jgi:hypothetical protein